MPTIDGMKEMFRRSKDAEERLRDKKANTTGVDMSLVKGISFEEGYQQGLIDAAGQEFDEDE